MEPRWPLLAGIALGFLACSGGNDIPIGTGPCDTCEHHDAGPGNPGKDAGPGDAGQPDSGFDAGPIDAGPDAGPPDAGPDAGPADSGPLTGQVCPDGSVLLSGEVLDLCQKQTLGVYIGVDGVQVATLAPYSATITADGGQYTICMPPNVPSTLQFTAQNYVTLYMPEITLVPNGVPPGPDFGRILLPCPSGIAAYAAELPTLDPALPFVYAQVDSVTNQQPCGSGGVPGVMPLAGYVFSASVPDAGFDGGGPWPIAYIDPSNDIEAVSQTFSTGTAVVYNIDPSVSYVTIQAVNPALTSMCPYLDTALGIDGRVYVARNAVSVYPWIVP